MGVSSSKESPYEKLAAHRESLYQRQLQYREQCDETQRQAKEQLRLGNRTGALNLARTLKTLQNQEKTVAGIVSNLDAQKASMETNELNAQTMQVMTHAVRSMGRGAISLSVVEDTMEINDDLAADLKEVADALALPYSTSDNEDELLNELMDAMAPSSTNEPPQHVERSNDEVFLEYMRAAALNLPDAPTHNINIGGATPPPTPVSQQMATPARPSAAGLAM